MTKKEMLIDLIQEMDTSDIVALHNEYCDKTNNYDDRIYDSDEINELCTGQDVYWIACRVFYGDFNPSAEYIQFDGYGNFKSLFNYQIPHEIDENAIADYILENDDDFDINDICYILSHDEEELNNELL